MRYLILFLILSFFMTSCTEDQQAKAGKSEKKVEEIKAGDRIRDIIRSPVTEGQDIDTTKLAKLVFEEKRFDFGTVNEGDIVKHSFPFINEGTVPLIITNAKSTCGCTIPEWPTEPIAPGDSGIIKVRFDTKKKTERQGKPITITANTYPRETRLQLKGFVTPK